jgi:hypothetical protein
MHRPVLLTLILCFIAATSLAQNKRQEPLDPRWKPAGYNDYETFTYDSKTLRKTPAGTIDVWIQFIYTDSGRIDNLKARAKAKLSTKGYENLERTLNHFEIDCANRTMRTLGFSDYDADGAILSSEEYGDKDKWHAVMPDTTFEQTLEAVCKAASK